tara:strand:- start:13471 stop:18324 length:4854 start_codon:yes stop_codon:yes gene_type:complete
MENEEPLVSPSVVAEDDAIVPGPSQEDQNISAATTLGLEPSNDFDYLSFEKTGKVNFSPEYFKDVMSMFQGTDVITSDSGETYTKTQVFAVQAADEFNAKYGMGSYEELKNGTSKYQPGLKFTDQKILETLTNMEEKGFLQSLGVRSIENIPSSAAFAASFAATKRATSVLPARLQRTGIPLMDKFLVPAETVYVAGKFALPYLTGIASSIASYPLGENFGELFFGEKKLPTPESYATMRAGEMASDVLTSSSFGYFADKAASDMLSDYLTNRLMYQGTRASKKNPLAGKRILKKDKYNPSTNPQGTLAEDASALAQDFDFSNLAIKPFGKQYKEAIKTISQLGTNRIIFGKPFQGPFPNMEDYAQRGVAAILQGNVAPRILRAALIAENALKNAGKSAKDNKALFAFYEGLAATGASLFGKVAAEERPFSGSETAAEIGGSVLLPTGFALTAGNTLNVLQKAIRASYPNIRYDGFWKGLKKTFKDVGEDKRASAGFKQLLTVLDEYGELNTPQQRSDLIKKLESLPANPNAKPTAGMLTQNPAIMAMEEALAKDFASLGEAQKLARKQEVDMHRLILDKLALGEGTEFSKDALRMSAEIEEIIFEGLINQRLSDAEGTLFEAYERVLRGDPSAAKKIRINQTKDNPKGDIPTASDLENMNNEDKLDLSNRLAQMLSTQKGFGRARQKELYNKAGGVELTSFFDDEGNVSTVPKFIAVLREAVDGGPIEPDSDLAKDLKQLINFAQKESDRLGVGVDLGADSPKLDAFNEARDSAYQQEGMMFFDRFKDGLGPLDSSDLPLEVSPEMISSINSAIRNRKKGSPTTRVFETYRDALIERGKRQGTINTRASARTEPTAEDVTAATDRLARIRQEMSDRGMTDALTDLEEYEQRLVRSELNTSSRISNFLSNELESLSAQPDPMSVALREGLEALAEVKRLEGATIRPTPETFPGSEAPAYGITVQRLNQMRSTALGMVRNGALSPNSRRVAGMFASAIEDDFDNFASFSGIEADRKSLNALKTANAFTKAFSNVFYRSYVGDALQETRQGVFRLAPETLAANLNTNRFDPNYLKIRDIQQVGEFAQEQGIAGAGETINSVNGVLDKILRMARSETIDPATNQLSPERLNEWINKNSRLEGLFPDLFADLKNFTVAKEVLNEVVINNSQQRAQINKQINFAALLRNKSNEIRTNPTAAVAEAMTAGKDQLISLGRLIKVIPKKGETREQVIYTLTDEQTGLVSKYLKRADALKARDSSPSPLKLSQTKLKVDRKKALEGFKSSLFEYLVLGNPGGRGQNKTEEGLALLNPTQIYQDLFEKRMITSTDDTKIGARRKPNKTTMSRWLIRNKVMSESELKQTKTALIKLMKIQAGELTGQLAADFAEAAPLLDFGISIFGSAVGTKTQSIFTGGNSGPGSIIAAGKGAEAARNIFLRMPKHQRMLLAANLLQDPALMAKMLREYGEKGQREGVVGALTNSLRRAGYTILPRRIFSGMEGDTFSDTEGFNPDVEEEPVAAPVAAPVKQRKLRDNFLNRLRQDAYEATPFSADSILPQTPPVVPPTPQAEAAPPPNQAASSGFVDRGRYAALWPNDMVSGLVDPNHRERTFAQGGIVSLMKGR